MRLLCIPLLFLSLTCFSQKPIHYVVEESQRLNNELQSSLTAYLSLTTEKQNSKNAFPYRLNISNIVYDYKQTPFFFSSIEPEKNLNITSSSLLLNSLIPLNRSFRFDIRNHNIVLDSLSIRNEIAAQLKAWKITEEVATNTETFVFTQIKQLIERLYPSGLEAKSQQSSSTSTQVGSKLYSLVKKDKSNLIYTVTDTSSTFKHEGELSVDKKKFFVSEARHSFTRPENSFASTVLIRMVDTPQTESKISSTYADILVMSSFLSRALYNDTELDSSKVMLFVAKLEKSPYSEKQSFVLDKLSLLQRIKNYDAYDEALNNSPIEFLKGTHHLSNILYRDDNISIEKFGRLVPLMDDASRYDWFQNSFYQDLNRDGDSYEEKLYLLVNGMTEEIGKSAYPMALWYKAKKAGNDLESQKSLVQYLLALDNDSWTKGNAGRYALLLYKDILLTDSLRSKSVLDGIIHKLEQVYGDTEGEEKKITKWFLSTAYYFAYQTNKDADSAVLLLEKAADYSPLTEKELAYSSNYDVAFLKGKKSYKEEYLDVLSSTQDKTIVLQHYVQNFLTSHANGYEALRNFYLNRFAEEDFSSFFTEQVLPQLDNAPAFVLNDLTNHKQTLENFKGKWTLVDFWGTWCGPCVAEMPKLNAFHDALKADELRSQKINFLTIACHDTEEKVKDFLTKNNYNIPVLMSDGEVQQHFKVTGYPSKYIISPEGKLLNIPFGFDWQPFLDHLAQL